MRGVNTGTIANRKTLVFRHQEIGGWSVPTASFVSVARDPIALAVAGRIANQVDDAERKREWKRHLASEVKQIRGDTPWDSSDNYAISLALKFCPGNHGHQPLDAENFLKPIIDAIAAGLFCDTLTDPATIESWDFDDSNFNTLLVHRLPDTADAAAEGIAAFVSAA